MTFAAAALFGMIAIAGALLAPAVLKDRRRTQDRRARLALLLWALLLLSLPFVAAWRIVVAARAIGLGG